MEVLFTDNNVNIVNNNVFIGFNAVMFIAGEFTLEN